MRIDLQGKTALVTGSTRGIGAASARQLAQCGARLILHGRTQTSVLSAVDAMRSAYPSTDVSGIVGDVATEVGCQSILPVLDDVDVLVHNAGVYDWAPFETISDQAWLHMFATHVMAGVRLSRVALPAMMRRGWGRIVFVASDSGVYIPPDMVHYGVSKAGELALMRGLAELTKGTGVTVNAVLPGPTAVEGSAQFFDDYAQRTGIARDVAQTHFVRAARPTSLIDRMATADEVANLISYVCSPLSAATNGAALRAEGGVLRHV
ncbi:oxidoreductase [Pandoraea captiosa]|uniref:Oxidoreductase n=1 Tax=Pandoraea captiosa TaxID=2508302 RepID=A0A5E5AD97_9BURK|nr:SDR family oxidoreductase [Pandoraea captiosa]VVE70090.1 oxidoreductase [Pandoraea captiosa]